METQENKDIEILKNEIEPTPQSGGIVPAESQDQINELIKFAENITQIIESQNKIRMAILKLTQPADWIVFGKIAELGFAAANRIGSTLGVSYCDWSSEKINGSDEKGSWYRWEYQCTASFRGRSIRVYGRYSSRDKFLGKKDGMFRELYDVDEGNIKMAAMRAAKKEGVKDLFGLHHLDFEHLKKYGIDLSSAGGHDFKNKDQQVEATQVINEKIKDERLEKSGKRKDGSTWNLYKITSESGVELFTFSDTERKKAMEAIKNELVANISYTINDKGSKVVDSIVTF